MSSDFVLLLFSKRFTFRGKSGAWNVTSDHVPWGNGNLQKSPTAQVTLTVSGILGSQKFPWQGSPGLRDSGLGSSPGSATSRLTVWGELRQFTSHTPPFALGFSLLSSEAYEVGKGNKTTIYLMFHLIRKSLSSTSHVSAGHRS